MMTFGLTEAAGEHSRLALVVRPWGVLARGSMPLGLFEAAGAFAEAVIDDGSEMVVASDIANAEGGSFAFTTRELLAAWRAERAAAVPPGELLNVRTWLKAGERGISANTVYRQLAAGESLPTLDDRRPGAPHDGDDLRRCVLLVAAGDADGLDWSSRMGELANVAGWENIAPQWADLVAMLAEELADDASRAPRTYERIKELRGDAE